MPRYHVTEAMLQAQLNTDPESSRSLRRCHYHAERFAAASSPQIVISRYESSLQRWEKHQILKHAVHVASWLALMPIHSPHLLAVAQLLRRYLHCRGRAQLSPRLKVALSLVSVRISNLRGAASTLGMDAMLESLWKELPAKCRNSAVIHTAGKKRRREIMKEVESGCCETVVSHEGNVCSKDSQIEHHQNSEFDDTGGRKG